MASIISQINWIGNGERADSVTLNRPLLEFLSKYETGLIELSSSANSIVIDPAIIDATVSTGELVSLSAAGTIVQASSSEQEIIGIIDLANNEIYLSGLVPDTLVIVNPNETYYQDLTTPGGIINTQTGSAVQVGKTIDKNNDGNGHLLLKITKNGKEEFTTVAGQTVFTTSGWSSSAEVMVFQDGVLLNSNSYTLSSPTVTLNTPTLDSDTITIKILDVGL